MFIFLFVKNKNDVKGLLAQMHPGRENARILGWVGSCSGEFSGDLMSSQFLAVDPREKMGGSSTKHLAYTKDHVLNS